MSFCEKALSALCLFVLVGCGGRDTRETGDPYILHRRRARQLMREALVAAERKQYDKAIRKAQTIKSLRMGKDTRHIQAAQRLSIKLHCLKRHEGDPPEQIPKDCRLHDGESISASKLQLIDMLDEFKTQEALEQHEH